MTGRVQSFIFFFFCLLFVVNASDDLASNILSDLNVLTDTDDTYACNKTNPCSNGACCAKSGYCGFGDKYCGTTDESPNDVCWSNCDAHAECGKDALPAGKGCPLNVCCSPFGFCGTTSEFCGTGCQSKSACNQPSSNATGGNVQQRVIGYYEAWQNDKQCMGMNVKQVPVESLTHINYAFAVIDPDTYDVGPMPKADKSTISEFTALKERNPNVVVGISIGGWDFNNNHTDTQGVFADIVSSKDKRSKFIGKLLSFMKHYAFDAVDLDWEYPGATDRQPPKSNTTANTEGYVALLQDIRKAFDDEGKGYELSFTAPTSYWYLRWFNIKEMAKAADYVNFMTYDLHGTWDRDDPIGNHVLAHTNLTEIKQAADLLWRNEVVAEKVNLGLAFYSRTFQLKDKHCTNPGCLFKGGGMEGACTKNVGTLSYRELVDVMASRNVTPTYDKEAAVKYFTWNEDQWASFDDQQTFQQKINWANDQGLGGLLIWSLDQDDSNLDDLRGVLYPADVKISDKLADDVSYWESQTVGDCQTSPCGGKCSSGLIEIETIDCPSGRGHQKICCPIASAPDPDTCHWRGNPGLCNGQCHGGEVAISSSVDGGNGHCTDGRQFYCCPIPSVAKGGGINCGWQESCRSDQDTMTFAGTFLEDIASLDLTGGALTSALNDLDLLGGKYYCCGKKEARNWKDCYWAGTPGKGFLGSDSCDDNHCKTGHEVELTTSYFGGGKSCSSHYERQRAWCCTPVSGKSLFLPVELDYLFPNAPTGDTNSEFNLKVDDTWGTGKSKTTANGDDEPNDASFAFVVITAPDEVSVSLDKRDGSPWEVMDCTDSDDEDERIVRVVCTDLSENTLCNKIHLGKGVPGTILQMPDSCGPGRYAVAKDFNLSANQILPGHLSRRDLGSSQVYDLSYDYNFHRVPRDYGDSQMRIDFSNEPGYWDAVVNRPGEKRTKRDMSTFGQNQKRWLEEEWRENYHLGGLSRHEIHKRWFAWDVLSWLANLVDVSVSSKTTEELTHSVDETVEVILIDQQFGPCPVGPAQAQANVRSTVNAHIQVDTTFGLTLITTLGDDLDLSHSYLFFKNKGEVTAKFELDAVASLTYSSGDIKLFGLDNFPGATFRVPGVVTVGPNLAVYASADAEFTLSGHLEAEVALAKWEIRQTYPENAKYPAEALQKPDHDGTQTVGKPSFEASVTATGEVALHLKPTVEFGIVFDKRWGVDKCTVDLVLDGYTIAHAKASASTISDNSCPFSYGIDAGSNIYATLNAPEVYGWGGNTRIPIVSVPRKQITPETCPAEGDKRRSVDDTDPLTGEYLPSFSSDSSGTSRLSSRDTFSLGPVITIPDSFLSCPGSSNSSKGPDCPVCGGDDDDDGGALTRRDSGDSCLYFGPPTSASCSDSSLSKRAIGNKEMTLSWTGKFDYSSYPQCSPNDLSSISKIAKWYLPEGALRDGKGCSPKSIKARGDSASKTVQGIPMSSFQNDHVFEVQFISMFLEWLCQGKENTYGPYGKIGVPKGWQRPDTIWCKAVFGTNFDGFEFQDEPNVQGKANWIEATANQLGGQIRQNLMALYFNNGNAAKKNMVAGALPGLGTTYQLSMNKIRDTVNVFSYLNDPTIKPKWTGASNGVELVSKLFDDNFWGKPDGESKYQNTGTPFERPSKPSNVQNWGLRTMWCYWIDLHLAKTEQSAAGWHTWAKNNLKASASTAKTEKAKKNIEKFVDTSMAHGAPLGPDQMKWPSGAKTQKSSGYGMWGDNGFGNLGL